MYRWLVARLQFTDDLLLHRQTPGNYVEFFPPLEGKAVDELIVNLEAGSSAIPAPGIHQSSPVFWRATQSAVSDIPDAAVSVAGRRLLLPEVLDRGCRSLPPRHFGSAPAGGDMTP